MKQKKIGREEENEENMKYKSNITLILITNASLIQKKGHEKKRVKTCKNKSHTRTTKLLNTHVH